LRVTLANANRDLERAWSLAPRRSRRRHA
jgi:hypothetical protein